MSQREASVDAELAAEQGTAFWGEVPRWPRARRQVERFLRDGGRNG